MTPSAGVTETVILFLGMGAAHYYLKCRRLKRDLKRVKAVNGGLIGEYNLSLRDVLEATDGPITAHAAKRASFRPEDFPAAADYPDETEDSDEQ